MFEFKQVASQLGQKKNVTPLHYLINFFFYLIYFLPI